LWPVGHSNADNDTFVDEILLADPSINLKAIPDTLECRIYKSTIELLLNVFYHGLANLHHVKFLAHEI
jgi:hypothetical protein